VPRPTPTDVLIVLVAAALYGFLGVSQERPYAPLVIAAVYALMVAWERWRGQR
jgi:hypothetical protein